MANFKSKLSLDFTITLSLSEEEARALNALTVYGTNAFLDMFYHNLGESYLYLYETGLRDLFASIEHDLRPKLSEIDKIRKEL